MWRKKLTLGATALCSIAVKNKGLQPNKESLELCHVQVVFRHGARTPLHVPSYIPPVKYEESLLDHSPKTYIPYNLVSLHGRDLKKSPFEKSYLNRGRLHGGCLPGQLTHIGADQMYGLGLYLKDRYVDNLKFLSVSNREKVKEIFVRSTNITRTILSARCVLAGMFSGEDEMEVVSIHVENPDQEILYPNYYTCTHFSSLTRWAWQDPEKLPGIKHIRKALQKSLDIPISEKIHLVDIYDNLAVERTHGKNSLEFSKHLLQQIEEGAMSIMHGAFIGIEAVRKSALQLAIGPFVNLLVCNIEEKCAHDADDSVRMHLYSGHDTTLIPLLSALGINDDHWPPYASNIILELYRSRSGAEAKREYFVKVIYNGEEMQIPGCSSKLCPLDEFRQAVSEIRISPERYHEDCAKDPITLEEIGIPRV